MTRPDSETLRRTMLAMTAERGAAKTVCPSEVARALAGRDEKAWRLLMAPIRAEAVRLAQSGLVSIERKGRPVDPGAFKGIYRLRAVLGASEASASSGPGNGASMRPVHQ